MSIVNFCVILEFLFDNFVVWNLFPNLTVLSLLNWFFVWIVVIMYRILILWFFLLTMFSKINDKYAYVYIIIGEVNQIPFHCSIPVIVVYDQFFPCQRNNADQLHVTSTTYISSLSRLPHSMGSLNVYHIGLCIRIELSTQCQLEKQVIIKGHYCLHNCNQGVST